MNTEKYFNPIIVLFLTFFIDQDASVFIAFQSYYSLIFNSHTPILADDVLSFQSYYSLIFNINKISIFQYCINISILL